MTEIDWRRVVEELPLAVFRYNGGAVPLNARARRLVARGDGPDLAPAVSAARCVCQDGPVALRWRPGLLMFVGPGAAGGEGSLVAVACCELDAPVRATDLVQTLGVRPREAQVASLVATGLTNEQIAAELSLSPSTVKTHLRNLYRRTGIGSRAELARRVEESGVRLVAVRDRLEPRRSTQAGST